MALQRIAVLIIVLARVTAFTSLPGNSASTNYTRNSFISGKSQLLLSKIDGEKPTFLNNLDIDSNGIIYLTETSKKWQKNQFFYSLFEGSGDGRYALFSSRYTRFSLVLYIYFYNNNKKKNIYKAS